FSHTPPPALPTLLPYTTLFRSDQQRIATAGDAAATALGPQPQGLAQVGHGAGRHAQLGPRGLQLPQPPPDPRPELPDRRGRLGLDRKSTRLNSSHVKISYAVFR